MAGLKLIRANLNPEVTARQDALVLYAALGEADAKQDLNSTRIWTSKGGGVFKGVYNDFGLTLNAALNRVTLRSGMGHLYGRQFELPGSETIEIDLSAISGAVSYISIFMQVDTMDPTNEFVSVESVYQAGSWPTISSDDLYENPQGVARLELYRIIKTRTGSTYTYTVQDQRGFIRPGVAQDTTKINGVYVQDVIDPSNNAARQANTTSAVRQYTFGTDGLNVTGNGVNVFTYTIRPRFWRIGIDKTDASGNLNATINQSLSSPVGTKITALRFTVVYQMKSQEATNSWTQESGVLAIRDHTYLSYATAKQAGVQIKIKSLTAAAPNMLSISLEPGVTLNSSGAVLGSHKYKLIMVEVECELL